MMANEGQEEQRFRAAVLKSWDPVWIVARYLHGLGNLWVRVPPLIIRPDFVSRAGYGDIADLEVCKIGGTKWTPVEVKGRTLVFDSRETYPYETIILDRSDKADKAEAYAYFILNASLSCAALIRGDTKPSWIGPKTYTDRSKGYDFTSYECPKALAEFITLR